MHSVRNLLTAAAARLGGEDGRGEAELLLAHALGKPRTWLFAWPEFAPDTAQCGAFERLVAARVRGEPVAYLTGHRGFWSFDLAVTPAVLIPRPETELLVELALARLPRERTVAVADLGTGSGLVAIAAAKAGAGAVMAADADPNAVTALRLNATANGVAIDAWAGDAANGKPPDVDMILAGDVFYEAALAAHVTAFCDRCLRAGIAVLVGDPGRTHLPRHRLRLLAEYAVADFGAATRGGETPAFVFAFEPEKPKSRSLSAGPARRPTKS